MFNKYLLSDYWRKKSDALSMRLGIKYRPTLNSFLFHLICVISDNHFTPESLFLMFTLRRIISTSYGSVNINCGDIKR